MMAADDDEDGKQRREGLVKPSGDGRVTAIHSDGTTEPPSQNVGNSGDLSSITQRSNFAKMGDADRNSHETTIHQTDDVPADSAMRASDDPVFYQEHSIRPRTPPTPMSTSETPGGSSTISRERATESSSIPSSSALQPTASASTFLSSLARPLRSAPALIEADLVYPHYQVLLDVQCTPRAPDGAPVPRVEPSSTPSDEDLRVLTLEDFAVAKPWSNAVFSPRTMTWYLWIEASTILAYPPPTVPSSSQEDLHSSHNAVPFFETSEIQSIAAVEQKKSIRTATFTDRMEGSARLASPHTSPFRLHKDHVSGNHFVSAEVPSSISPHMLAKIKSERRANPPPGQTGDQALHACIKVLIRILANASRNDSRSLPLSSQTIRNKLGYDAAMEELLLACGMYKASHADTGVEVLKAARDDQDLTLRNLLEVIAWWEFNRPNSNLTLDTDTIGFSSAVVRIEPSDYAASFLGWDSRHEYTDAAQQTSASTGAVKEAASTLGVTLNCNDALIERAYNLNKAQQPGDATRLLSALETIYQQQRPQSEDLMLLVTKEKSQELVSVTDAQAACLVLGLDAKHVLDGTTDEGAIRYAHYAACRKGELERDQSKIETAEEALRIIATYRRQTLLDPYAAQMPVEKAQMSIQQAYSIFNMDPDAEAGDDSLIAAYITYLADVQDDGLKQQNFHDALAAIARHRASDTLLNFIKTWNNPDQDGKCSPDLGRNRSDGLGSPSIPAGLNNIGNTCYLNSVLQYFFALRPLREAVLREQQRLKEAASGTAGTGGSPSGIKVGGRAITPYETERSSKFVIYLAQLFDAMITSPAPAVTPERDLAYLALVSARVEEVEQGSLGIEAPPTTLSSGLLSNDNVIESVKSPSASSKQAKIYEEPGMDAEKKAQAKEAEAAEVNLDRGDNSVKSLSRSATVENPKQNADLDEQDSHSHDVDDSSPGSLIPSPLPPRPPTNPEGGQTHRAEAGTATPRQSERRNSLMKLGAQQDVSECLDNVLFQIEVALVQASQAAPPQIAPSPIDTHEAQMPQCPLRIVNEIAQLFTGRTRQHVQKVDAGGLNKDSLQNEEGIKEEIFTILPIDVLEEEGRDVYDSLDGFFNSEILSTATTSQDDAAHSEKARPGSSLVQRTVTLLESPPILQIQLQRVQFDRDRGAYKSQAHLAAREDLYLDRYLDANVKISPHDDDTLLRRREAKQKQSATIRSQINSARERLAVLNQVPHLPRAHSANHNKATVSQTLEKAERAITTLASVAPELGAKLHAKSSETSSGNGAAPNAHHLLDLAAFLGRESKEVKKEIDELHAIISGYKEEIERLWESKDAEDPQRLKYRLVSVFMHRGEATHGHYFLEQRRIGTGTGLDDGRWFKYNDSEVSTVDFQEVLRDRTGATPYLLCYVRDDLLSQAAPGEEIFETLRRDLGGILAPHSDPSDQDRPEDGLAGTLHGPVEKADLTLEEPPRSTAQSSPSRPDAEMSEIKG